MSGMYSLLTLPPSCRPDQCQHMIFDMVAQQPEVSK
jgi:hypothetical protein